MATLYGANKTIANAGTSLVEQGDGRGRVKCMFDKYVYTSGTIGASDVIQFGQLPAGARVVAAKAYWTDLGTTGAGTLGYLASADGVEAADTDAFLPSMDFSSAGQILSDSALATNVGVMIKRFAAPVTVALTMTAATTTTGSIYVMVEYVLD